MKLRRVFWPYILAGSMAFGGVSCVSSSKSVPVHGEKVYQESKGILDLYNFDDIHYRDFSDLDFDGLTEEELPLPKELQDIRNYGAEIKDLSVYSTIRDTLEKHALNGRKPKDLSPRELVEVSRDMVCHIFSYLEVDDDEWFIREHGKRLPFEQYLLLGLGDCDKYTRAHTRFFADLKALNRKGNNVYLLRDIGGKAENHAWNTAVLLFPDKLEFSYVDPTFFDSEGKYEADEFHLDREIVKYKFLLDLGCLDFVPEIDKKLAGGGLSPELQGKLLYMKADILYLWGMYDEAEKVGSEFLKRGLTGHMDYKKYQWILERISGFREIEKEAIESKKKTG